MLIDTVPDDFLICVGFNFLNFQYYVHYKHVYASVEKKLVISCKILIITVISNETTNELTIYAILCQNVKIFHRQKLASLFQVQENLKACRNSK